MKTPDCLLINPRSSYYSKAQKAVPYLPAGLLSIASTLKHAGFHPFVLDMVTEDNPLGTLTSYLDEAPGRVRLVGFTVMTTQIRHAADLSRNAFP